MTIILTESQKSKLSVLAELLKKDTTNDFDALSRNTRELVEEGIDIPTALYEQYGIDVNSDDDDDE